MDLIHALMNDKKKLSKNVIKYFKYFCFDYILFRRITITLNNRGW